MRNLILAAAATVLLAMPGVAAAQATASIQAQATVLAPISATDVQDLQFGDVIPGFASTVAPADADAGQFRINGAGALEVSISFGTLPTSLDHTTSASTLPLSFGASSAGIGTTATAVAATFDPSAAFTTNLAAGELFVFLGGTVTPAVAQEAGTYDGTVTMTVAYTGN